MQFFERDISFLLHSKACFWKIYVDDVFLIFQTGDLNEILKTANCICPAVQFTIHFETNLKLPFLSILIQREEKVTYQEILTPVYRKITFTSQYFNLNSENQVSHKIAVGKTSCNRPTIYCIDNASLQLENEKVFTDLNILVTIYVGQKNYSEQYAPFFINHRTPTNYVSIPNFKNLSEKISNVFKSNSISIAFKPKNVMKCILRKLKPMISTYREPG